VWGGDQNTDWGYDDGLPTVVPIGAHVGLGGVSIFGSDVGGYTSVMIPPTTKSLFFRWTGLAAFTPLMRTHHGSTECRNWSFDRDPETLAHYRRYASIHTRLFPYLRDLLADALASGWPLMRHPALVEPGAPNLWAPGERAFFLGDDLFVSPVVDEGAEDWPVTLPPGAWWPLLGGAVVQGGVDVVRAAPLTEVPAFVRAGTALPLLTDTPVTLYPLADDAEAGLQGLEAARLRITIALYPEADGRVRPQRLRGLYGADDAGPEVHAEGLPETGEAVVVGPGEAALGASGRVFVRGGPVDVTYTFVVGGAAWGELRASTPVGDPNPDIPPPCEVGRED
jgi:alpha-glucosidase (family GH31 glycosyl hydrolase)